MHGIAPQSWPDVHNPDLSEPGPMWIAVRKSNRRAAAISYLRLCLNMYPFLWSAYELLCNLGIAAAQHLCSFMPRCVALAGADPDPAHCFGGENVPPLDASTISSTPVPPLPPRARSGAHPRTNTSVLGRLPLAPVDR